MPFSSYRLMSAQVIAALFLMMAVVILSNIGRINWLSSAAIASKSATQKPAETPTPEPITAESLTLTETGFFPREFSHPKGRFILAINDRTGLPENNFILSRDVGNNKREKVRDAKILRHQPDWNDLIDLTPGNYLITEASNPKWECRLTITPK